MVMGRKKQDQVVLLDCGGRVGAVICGRARRGRPRRHPTCHRETYFLALRNYMATLRRVLGLGSTGLFASQLAVHAMPAESSWSRGRSALAQSAQPEQRRRPRL